MTLLDLLQKLSALALVLEILHRTVLAIINALRLVFSAEYRAEIFGASTDDSLTTILGE
jgi:hypothetical protein